MSIDILKRELQIKVVLLGESGVGKSCIILRYINNIFSLYNISTTLSTCATKRVSYNNNKDIITYNIWDTAGQEKFRSIAKINYKDADVILLVFDITNQKTFQCIKDYWYLEVKENAPENIIIALVAAKCDLSEEKEINSEDAELYAKSINSIYIETSSLDNTGINDLFDSIGKKILSNNNLEEKIFLKNNSKISEENQKKNRKNIEKKKNKNKETKKKSGCC